MQTSPGGSTFPYYYKGGALHCLKFGSFHADESALLAVMQAEEVFMAGQKRRLPVWVDFYETRLTDSVLGAFLGSMQRLQSHISKLAVVGCAPGDKRRLHRLEKKTGIRLPLPVRFFSDPEEAKTWLVGGGK